MIRQTLLTAILSVTVAAPALADTASGMPTGKRQHKPVSVTKPVDEGEQSSEMNKADLTESLANKTEAKEKKGEAEKRAAETLRHKDRAAADEKTDKNEAARAKKKKKKD